MMFILNRLRGTWGWMAKVNGVILGLLFWFITGDTWMLLIAPLYVLGESMGWGKWLVGVYEKRTTPLAQHLTEKEGYKNGIHYIANYLFPEHKNYYRYCYTALTIRGIYWFSITLLPLTIFGYVSLIDYLVSTLLLGVGFPLSVRIGALTDTKWGFKFMDNFWEHAEVWYGLIQDIVILLLILTMI